MFAVVKSDINGNITVRTGLKLQHHCRAVMECDQ